MDENMISLIASILKQLANEKCKVKEIELSTRWLSQLLICISPKISKKSIFLEKTLLNPTFLNYQKTINVGDLHVISIHRTYQISSHSIHFLPPYYSIECAMS